MKPQRYYARAGYAPKKFNPWPFATAGVAAGAGYLYNKFGRSGGGSAPGPGLPSSTYKSNYKPRIMRPVNLSGLSSMSKANKEMNDFARNIVYPRKPRTRGLALARGFVKTYRKPAKPKGWQAGKGVTMTIEAGGTLAAQNIVYIGHITAPADQIRYQAFQAMLKLLLTRMNVRIRDFNAPMNEVKIFPGDVFTLIYSSSSTTAGSSSASFNVLAASTFDDVVLGLISSITGTINVDWIPKVLEYNGTATSLQYASIALDQLMLHFDIKSTLKVQNRSVTSVGAGENEADAVDNVPLYGKTIGGSGTGVVCRFPNSVSPANIVGRIGNGLITNQSLDNNASEPLSAYFFPKSTQQGKVHIEPGALKTSVLSTKRSISFKYLFRLFANQGTQPITSFGSYRFFQLEKMIDTGLTQDLSVAYEHNLAMSCYATTKYNWTSSPIFKRVP